MAIEDRYSSSTKLWRTSLKCWMFLANWIIALEIPSSIGGKQLRNKENETVSWYYVKFWISD